MKNIQNSRARLLVNIPAERYRIFTANGCPPKAGDIVILDQGYIGEDGLAMVLVFYPNIGNKSIYEAEVYESELE